MAWNGIGWAGLGWDGIGASSGEKLGGIKNMIESNVRKRSREKGRGRERSGKTDADCMPIVSSAAKMYRV